MVSTRRARPRSGLGLSRRPALGTNSPRRSPGTASAGSGDANNRVTPMRSAAQQHTRGTRFCAADKPSRMAGFMPNDPLVVRSRADFDQLISLTAAKPPFLPPAVRAALAQEFERHADAYDRIGQDFLGRDLVEGQLDNISIPCLVIWGEKDEIISPSSAQVWHQHLRHSKLVTMPGIGHLPMLEDPNGSAQVVAQFIATLPSSAERSR